MKMLLLLFLAAVPVFHASAQADWDDDDRCRRRVQRDMISRVGHNPRSADFDDFYDTGYVRLSVDQHYAPLDSFSFRRIDGAEARRIVRNSDNSNTKMNRNMLRSLSEKEASESTYYHFYYDGSFDARYIYVVNPVTCKTIMVLADSGD